MTTTATPTMICDWCRLERPWVEMSWWDGWNPGVWHCCPACSHAAGFHHMGCPCTPYVKRRRCLREHRAQMRVMQAIIDENNLQYSERVWWETGNNAFRLHHIPAWDDGSDVEDPDDPAVAAATVVADTAAAAADRQALVDAVGGVVEHRLHSLEVERLRMKLADAEGFAGRARGGGPCRE